MSKRTTSNPDAYQSYRQALRRAESVPEPRPPWLLAILALSWAVLVVIGSLGPWLYRERVSETVPETSTLYGLESDGKFSLLFAVVAIGALLIALFRPGAGNAAWIAFSALVLCAVIGLFDWLIYASSEQDLEPGEVGRIVRVEWGVKVVGLAGAVGAIMTYLLARALNRY